jgi:hypothetical protein
MSQTTILLPLVPGELGNLWITVINICEEGGSTRFTRARDIIALLSLADIFLEWDLERAFRSRMAYSKL